jgi:hypothetical protein
LWAAWGLFALQWRAIARCDRDVPLATSRPIVCLGDSLTSGLLPDRGYPAQLQKLIRLDVINLGQSGIATEAGFERLSRAAQFVARHVANALQRMFGPGVRR